MFPLRLVLTCLWFFGFSLLFLPVVLIRPFHPNNSFLYCRGVVPFSLWLMGIKLEKRSVERVEASRPCVILINHQSLIDVFIMGSIMPHMTVTVGKKSLIWIPLFGWIFWLSGNLLIDRRDREKAVSTMQRAEAMVKQKGLSVIVAPEGTRSGQKTLGPFKRGAFHLAQNTNLDLQPVVISPLSHINFWRLRTGKVIVEASESIRTAGKSIEQLMAETHQKISETLDKLDTELARSPV